MHLRVRFWFSFPASASLLRRTPTFELSSFVSQRWPGAFPYHGVKQAMRPPELQSSRFDVCWKRKMIKCSSRLLRGVEEESRPLTGTPPYVVACLFPPHAALLVLLVDCWQDKRPSRMLSKRPDARLGTADWTRDRGRVWESSRSVSTTTLPTSSCAGSGDNEQSSRATGLSRGCSSACSFVSRPPLYLEACTCQIQCHSQGGIKNSTTQREGGRDRTAEQRGL